MKTNKLLLSALAVSVMTPAIVAPIPTDAATYSKTFKDVPKTHTYYTMIHDMAKEGIISGYADGTFKPNETISRQHAALLINNAVKLQSTIQLKEFQDIPSNHIYYEAIQRLQTANLIQPDAKGNFNPSKALTRGEMAKIIATAYNLKVKADYTFNDVEGTEYEAYVKALYSNGIAAGYEDGTFKPNEPLTRVHYALFMNRAENLDPNFIAKPIETNIKEPIEEPIENSKPIIEIVGMDRKEVPLPKGVTNASELLETQTAKQKELAISQRHTTFRTFTLDNSFYLSLNSTLEEMLENESSKHMRISYEELVNVINQVVKTGEVYNGGHYTVFYSFKEGLVKTTIAPTTYIR